MPQTLRRSSRANRGKKTKQLEEEEREIEEQLKRYEEEIEKERLKEEDGHVLCSVCATTDSNFDEEDDEHGAMIQCDQCQTWQHLECMRIKKAPEKYKCNVCDPKHKRYRGLKCELDPVMARRELEKDAVKKRQKQEEYRRLTEELDARKRTGGSVANGEEDDDDDDDYGNKKAARESDGDNDDDEDDVDEDDEKEEADLGTDEPNHQSKRSSSKRSSMSARAEPSSEKHETKRRKRSTTSGGGGGSSQTPTPSIDHDEIEHKAREAVTKRFEGMFLKLLKGYSKIEEEGSKEDISARWSKKLEEALCEAYLNSNGSKSLKMYKEVSLRIFSNVKDPKNSKLRNSIVYRSIPFNKLVKMKVDELLNPDLRKEKEEAVKESITLATLEKVEMSNIRRTHKGDIVLEKEDSTNTANQYDFNVGISRGLDEKEKPNTNGDGVSSNFIKADTEFNNYDNHNDYNDFNDNDNDNNKNMDSNIGNGTDNHADNGVHNSSIFEEDDELLNEILGVTKDATSSKPQQEEVDEYDPTESTIVPKKTATASQSIWEGQTIFTGVSNFKSKLVYQSTNLFKTDFQLISHKLSEEHLPLEVQGRLDGKKAQEYINQVSAMRKFILLELKPYDDDIYTMKNFKKLFEYFDEKNKYGVVSSFKQEYLKDIYLFPIYKRLPKFMKLFDKEVKFENVEKRIFAIFVVKPEAITPEMKHEFHMSQQPKQVSPPPSLSAPPTGFEHLSRLDPNRMATVLGFLDNNPHLKENPALLLQHLQHLQNMKAAQ